ncbi:cupin domain-containing protein [Marinomonas ostreistagni]|uniref:cupin domain-containing protein n=1 Tax=Marinomonas ostreistagni TaxID=359209 RepID=UPI00194FFFDA|nr:cupin domain-containing protein [Marinomonas ostreistagni]MBM6550908.1 cupin domain-containing protein [Marinomonas ostreistagni]
MIENLLQQLPLDTSREHFEPLINASNMRIERIVTPPNSPLNQAWYDQTEDEWVMVLEGYGVLVFDDGRIVTLKAGDWLNIPAHSQHRVIKTDPEHTTIWLAVFYQA